MRIGSLFAGIGGFDLAARWAGWSTAWVSEIDPYASRVLAKHFPDAPNHGDITAMGGQRLEPVDVLCGGFPCQDISFAGKGEGIGGARSGLWKHYARLVDALRPGWVVAENVSALRSRGLDVVLQDLAQIGYDADWHCIPASFVGAPHRRDRIWIIAFPQGDVVARGGFDVAIRARAAAMADAHSAGRGEHGGAIAVPAEQLAAECGRLHSAGRDAAAWWAVEPDVGRVVHGVPDRVDRLRCLGNAIVPQVAHMIFSAINDVEAVRGLIEARAA